MGIAPIDKGPGASACRPSSTGMRFNDEGMIYKKRDPALYDEERIKRCEIFYNDAERQRKQALSEDLEEHMSST